MPQHWCSPLLRTTPDGTPASGISDTHGPQEHSREPRDHPALKKMKTYKPGKLKLGNLKAGKPLDWLLQCQNGVIWFLGRTTQTYTSQARNVHPSRTLPPHFNTLQPPVRTPPATFRPPSRTLQKQNQYQNQNKNQNLYQNNVNKCRNAPGLPMYQSWHGIDAAKSRHIFRQRV